MTILPREMGGPGRRSKLRRIVIETAIVVAADQNCAESSSKLQLSSPPIEIALHRHRSRNCPSRQSKLRQIVVETTIVLAADRNCAEASSKPQLSSSRRSK